MDFKGANHVYWVAPPTNGNQLLPESEQVLIGLKCVTIPDLDAEQLVSAAMMAEHPQSKWAEAQKDRTYKLIESKFCGVKNLTINGEAVRDFNHFYSDGPPEMVSWVCKAIYKSEVLSDLEIKN